jgi:hypothetical protein
MGKGETKKASQRPSRKAVIQVHHISYDPEETVRLRKCEHLVLTRLSWYTKKQVSRGLIRALKVFIALNEDRAKEV